MQGPSNGHIGIKFLVDSEVNEHTHLKTIDVAVQIVLFFSAWDKLPIDHG